MGPHTVQPHLPHKQKINRKHIKLKSEKKDMKNYRKLTQL